MPRRNRDPRGGPKRAAQGGENRPLSGGVGWAQSESGPDGEWLVRKIPGTQATKFYRCPGCVQEIRPGTPHVVAWPAEGWGSVEDRRHWHADCWASRNRRGPTSRRW